MGLIGEYPHVKNVIVVGVMGAMFSYFIRRLPLEFGVNTLLSIVVLALMMRFILKITITRGIMAAFFGVIAVGIIESMSIPIVSYFTGISFETALHDPWLRVLFPLPDEIILGVMAYACRRWRFSLIPGYGFPTNVDRKEKEDEK
ncbi:hypothetical protein SDD30_00605 [Moorella naiadis]|uniref:hypothetical protein n=1 Tax=Moorella naiadis (nom. illeg.) TaxID=3093670 RepID=UPI003D9C95E4